jgi:hypothetical protein
VAGSSGRTRTSTQAKTQTKTPPKTQPRTQPPQRERGTGQPDGGRGRTAAAERAYARRAQRTERATGTRPAPQAERKQGSASRATFVILVIVLLIGGVVATLWFSTQATADAYKLEQAKNTTNQLQVRVGQLQQQVARQDSPQWLANQAKHLGMIPAGDAAHLVVGANGKVTVIGTPSAAEPPPPPPKPTVTSTTPPPSGANKPANGASTATTPTTTPSTTAPANPAGR